MSEEDPTQTLQQAIEESKSFQNLAAEQNQEYDEESPVNIPIKLRDMEASEEDANQLISLTPMGIDIKKHKSHTPNPRKRPAAGTR